MKTNLNYPPAIKNTVAATAAISLTLALGTAIYFANINPEDHSINAGKLLQATRSYVHLLAGKEQSLPDSVTVKDLITQGLLAEADVPGFHGMDVSLKLSADDIQPHEVLVRARYADGDEIVVLGDGSVQQRSKNRINAERY
jgi:hypothetical protein